MPAVTGACRATRPAVSRLLPPDKLGRIVVARFLELSLRAFEQRVQSLERTPRFRELWAVMRVASVSGSPPVQADPSRAANLLGVAQPFGDRVAFRYASPAFDREYAFDEVALGRLLARGDRDLTRLVSHLRLVNTRNRLTHALVQALLETQRDYVLTGDPLRLKPLSQAALSRQLRASGGCPVDADPSRLSRLLRRLAVCLPTGTVVALRNLCPMARDLLRLYVSQVIKEERARMVGEGAPSPMADREIAAAVRRRFGARLLPRTVAYVRRDLGLPGSRARGRRSAYLAATTEFSLLRPLTEDALRSHVPPGPGVYELRVQPVASGACPIIYLGSARDLRKRLTDHLRGYSGNVLLQAHVRRGVRVRFRMVATHWREVERTLYRAFCATFGAPPLCNRMSP